MSMKTLEAAILVGACVVLNNPKLRLKDILVWSTGDVEVRDGEVAVRVPDPGVNVCVAVAHDKRAKESPPCPK
jgi:hypothetical protein